MSETNVTYNSLKDVPASKWEKLAQKKIFFGHQSIGNNIMDGIKELMTEYPEIKLNIIETADKSTFSVGILAHSKVGKNTDPKSKIDEFVGFMNQGIGKKVDAAALKFCYVDITGMTKVENILNDYSVSINQLEKNYPNITIIHFTDPLTTVETTWKTLIKKLMRKEYIWEYDDNVKRNQYNEMLLKKYEKKEPVFDIAKIQSTFPDGTRSTFTRNKKTYYSMVPAYSNDGGHLNKLGRKRVAEQLLLLLVNLN